MNIAAITSILVLHPVRANPACNDESIESAVHPSELVGVLPRGLTSFGADVLDGWLYVFGGYHGRPHAYSREGQSAEFYRIDLRDTRVIEFLDGAQPMQSAPLLACGDRLVRAGGLVAENAAGEKACLRSLATAAVFDPDERTWVHLPDLPRGRSSHDLELVGGRVWVVGGWTLAGDSKGEFAQTIAMLDLEHRDAGWTETIAPFRARALAAARLGARLAAIGGIDAQGESVRDVRIFDPEHQTWSAGPGFPGEPFGLSAATIDGVVYACGSDGVVWRLAEGHEQWTQAGTLAFPRFFHQLVADGAGALVCLGGIDEMRPDGRVRHIERLDPNEPTTARVAYLTLPAPLTARNRQGCIARENALLFFGGNRSLGQHDFEPEDFSGESWSLDLSTLAWRERAPLPEPRQTIAATISSDGAIGFAVGGFAHDGEHAVSRRAGFHYDFGEDAWTHDGRLDLEVPRTQLGLVRHERALWVFGGLDYDPRRGERAFELPLDVLVLKEGAAQFVSSGVEISTPRRAFASAEMGGKAYLVGGMREEFASVETSEAFDFETQRFARIASPRAPRVSASLVALGARLYLAGGSSRGADGRLRPDRSIEAYDPVTDRWSMLLESLPEPMEHLQAFALRDRLLLVSTHIQGPAAIRLCFVSP